MAIKLPDANDEKCLILFEKMKKQLISYSDSINIKNVDQKFFKEIVIPIALYLIGLDKTSKPVLIGLTGGQGSGKTTLSDYVQLTLRRGFNKKLRDSPLMIYINPQEIESYLEKKFILCVGLEVYQVRMMLI